MSGQSKQMLMRTATRPPHRVLARSSTVYPLCSGSLTVSLVPHHPVRNEHRPLHGIWSNSDAEIMCTIQR
jgi:hypothetical protein